MICLRVICATFILCLIGNIATYFPTYASEAYFGAEDCAKMSHSACIKICKDKEAKGFKNVGIEGLNFCTIMLRTDEAKAFKGITSCNAKACIYKLVRTHKTNVFSGSGISLQMIPSTMQNPENRAIVIDQNKRKFVFQNDCEEGPCTPFELMSGPDRGAKLSVGSGDTWIFRLPK